MKTSILRMLFFERWAFIGCLAFFLSFGNVLFADDPEPGLPPDVEFFSPELPDNTNLELVPMLPEAEEIAGAGEEEELVPPTCMQDYWEDVGVSLSMREPFQDGIPWQRLESSSLIKFFYEMREAPPEFLTAWARPEAELANFEKLSPSQRVDARFELYRITGTLKNVREVPLSSEFYTRFRMRKYWVVEMELSDGRPVSLYSLNIPRLFQTPEKLRSPEAQNARIGAYATLMKFGEGQPPLLYMLTHRLEHYPHNFLGDRGMDFGLFDDLDRKPLSPKDIRSRTQDLQLGLHNRECFYRLLHTVSNIPRGELRKHSMEVLLKSPPDRLTDDGKYSSPLPIFQRPIDERGHYFLLRGTAKTVIPVRVEDDDIIERYGITKYYQMAIFTPESGDNPIFVIVTELPEGMKTGHDAEYIVDVTVPAFFFNTWAYSSRTADGKRVKRLTPLLIGGTPIFTPRQEPIRARWIEAVLAVLIAGGILTLGLFMLYSERKEQTQRRKLLESRGLPEGEVLDETKFDRTGYPDFTHWGEEEEK